MLFRSANMRRIAVVIMGLSLAFFGCSGESQKSDSNTPDTGTTEKTSTTVDNSSCSQEKFVTLANDLLVSKCSGCHKEGQIAGSTDLLLDPSDSAKNYQTLVTFLNSDGAKKLLDKATGTVSHNGGSILVENTADYNAIGEWISYESNQVSCAVVEDATTTDKSVQNISFNLLSVSQTLRNASLSLLGRLPTQKELASLDDESDLKTTLDSYMSDEHFYDWLKEVYNDRFFTDRYLTPLRAEDLVSRTQFPDLRWWDSVYENNRTLRDRARTYVRYGIARAPLELIEHIVRNDRSYEEIITADYTMVNSFSAKSYGITEGAFDASIGDFNESHRDGFFVAKIPGIPHAGVMSEITWLNVFPSTQTNRNRHRARKVMEFFLGTDILKLGERPLDSDEALVLNPTKNSPACTVCHYIMDPIAGGFQNWDFNGRFDVTKSYINRDGTTWYTDMELPGLSLKEQMPLKEYSSSLSWLAKAIVKDDRFALSAVHILYKGLTGRSALFEPLDSSEADYAPKLEAYTFQKEIGRASCRERV